MCARLIRSGRPGFRYRTHTRKMPERHRDQAHGFSPRGNVGKLGLRAASPPLPTSGTTDGREKTRKREGISGMDLVKEVRRCKRHSCDVHYSALLEWPLSVHWSPKNNREQNQGKRKTKKRKMPKEERKNTGGGRERSFDITVPACVHRLCTVPVTVGIFFTHSLTGSFLPRNESECPQKGAN